MNILKTILLGGAAYYALKNGVGSSDMQKQLDELSEENDALRVQLIDKEQELKDEKNKAAGELQGQLNAFLYVRASRVKGIVKTWHTGYDLIVTNTGNVTRCISAVRVFWTAEGYTSIWSPWSTSAYTLKPGQSVKMILNGTYFKKIFNTNSDVTAVANMFGDAKSGSEYVKRIPLKCEAEFILAANGQTFCQQLKDFDGELKAYTDHRIIYPYSEVNGTNQKDINKAIEDEKERRNPSTEDEE